MLKLSNREQNDNEKALKFLKENFRPEGQSAFNSCQPCFMGNIYHEVP